MSPRSATVGDLIPFIDRIIRSVIIHTRMNYHLTSYENRHLTENVRLYGHDNRSIYRTYGRQNARYNTSLYVVRSNPPIFFFF